MDIRQCPLFSIASSSQCCSPPRRLLADPVAVRPIGAGLAGRHVQPQRLAVRPAQLLRLQTARFLSTHSSVRIYIYTSKIVLYCQVCSSTINATRPTCLYNDAQRLPCHTATINRVIAVALRTHHHGFLETVLLYPSIPCRASQQTFVISVNPFRRSENHASLAFPRQASSSTRFNVFYTLHNIE